MLKRLLIANRGEIARRVIRTCERLGVETVAVYSDADAGAPHVREATAAVRIGPPPARESYLDMAAVLAAARESGADSVHPGYGFLSENAAFAEAVIAAGLVWVGPPPSAIRAMGLKDAAKRLMSEAGVPVTPGYLGDDQSPERLAREADAVGYPVLIKAVAGGGGKGMRRVDEPGGFAEALAGAKREGASSFGDDRVLIEKYVTRPRHIEVQVFADTHGNFVHLYERDCSLQRRHQKVIEEAPAPGMDAATRTAVCAAAVKAARAVAYEGAGTVEFIADASGGLRADRIWFMEMNTRLQVEHPVTEMITGQDLVEWQLRVASGEPLPLTQDAIPLNGWAMEARLYAENPAKGFLPSTGKLEHFAIVSPKWLREHPSVRIDSGVTQGGEVTPFYDPMIAKLIVHGETREHAVDQLSELCAHVRVAPVVTNAGFLKRVADHPEFVAGGIDTGFIDRNAAALTAKPEPDQVALDDIVSWFRSDPLYDGEDGKALDEWALTGFRINRDPQLDFSVWVDGERRRGRAVVTKQGSPHLYESAAEGEKLLFVFGETYRVSLSAPLPTEGAAAGSGQLSAPMPGRIVSVSAHVGDEVKRGAAVVALEAMKMEHALTAPFDARVAEVSVAVGDQVVEGAVLARLEAL